MGARAINLGGFKDIQPPPACSQAISSFIAENPGVPIDVLCITPPADTTLPIFSQPCRSNVLCCIEISREPFLRPDGILALRITFVVNVPLHLVVSGNGTVICEFDTFIKLFEQDIICPQNETNFQCRITQILCHAVFMNETQIVVDVSICKEIVIISPEACPPVGQFPPQCRTIFPPMT
ncbi:MAG TPA: hypothetical protein DDY49_06255 [Paenibacillaceae bacterium]|nr:hypothetical protein [Paenibacillaceae bacterium]